MQGSNFNPGTGPDPARAILDWAHALMTTSLTAAPEALLEQLARAAAAESAILVRIGVSGSLAIHAGEAKLPPDILAIGFSTPLAAISIAGPDGAAWIVAATGSSGSSQWLLGLCGDASRIWTDSEKAALALAADAIHRYLLARPDTALACRQHRLEQAAGLSARIAHDYGNVLTSLLGFAELGLAELNPSDRGVYYLTEIRRAAEEGARFTNRLRQFGRPGQSTSAPVPLDLVLRDEVRRLTRETNDGITVRLVLPPSLPRVAISADLLRTLFAQLLDNASDALGRCGQVIVAVRQATLTSTAALTLHGNPTPGACAEVAIEDAGPGLKPEVGQRVLTEPLFTTKPRHRGLGLGIALGIARANGAGLRFEPRTPNGTVVRVFLPLEAQPESTAQPRSDDQPQRIERSLPIGRMT